MSHGTTYEFLSQKSDVSGSKSSKSGEQKIKEQKSDPKEKDENAKKRKNKKESDGSIRASDGNSGKKDEDNVTRGKSVKRGPDVASDTSKTSSASQRTSSGKKGKSSDVDDPNMSEKHDNFTRIRSDTFKKNQFDVLMAETSGHQDKKDKVKSREKTSRKTSGSGDDKIGNRRQEVVTTSKKSWRMESPHVRHTSEQSPSSSATV